MTAVAKDHVLTDPQLYTFLTEAENIANSRPLTHLSEDVTDLAPLTPNHILLGKHHNWSYVCDTTERDIISRKKWKQVQGLSDVFWKRWKNEYMPELTKRSKWTDRNINFKVDELALLQDENLRRGKWPLARVTKVTKGDDGAVRVVEIRTKDGTYIRPAAKLLRLEDNENEIPQGEGHVA